MNKKTIDAGRIEFYYIEHNGWLGQMHKTRSKAVEDFDDYMQKFPHRDTAQLKLATFVLEGVEVLKAGEGISPPIEGLCPECAADVVEGKCTRNLSCGWVRSE